MKELYRLMESIYLEYKVRKSSGKEVYYIKLDNEVSGFFAILRAALDYCCYADEHGFLPYIVYGRKVLYSEKKFFLGTNNPFEYYYEQPMMFSVDNWVRGLNIIKGRMEHMDKIELKYNLKGSSYIVEESYIERMANIYRKYIHLNTMTSKKIEKSVKNVLQRKYTLGVHIRGTDFYKEFNNHPVPVTVDEYIEAINEEIISKRYEQVFVATDDIRCLKELKKKIQAPLVYYMNTLRANGNKSVAYERNERKNNNYLLGLEVLKDAYTLSACDGFVGCLSQVDMFVQIIKKSRGEEFSSLRIINKGIYMNNRQCWEPTR